jgi:hypothetical protein
MFVAPERIAIWAEGPDGGSGQEYVSHEHLEPLEVSEDLDALIDDGCNEFLRNTLRSYERLAASVRALAPGTDPARLEEQLRPPSRDTAVVFLAHGLLRAVAPQATPRQLRLFAVACCRAAWDWFTEESSRAAIRAAEQFADGLASVSDLDAVRREAYRARAAGPVYKMAADVAKRDARQAADLVVLFASWAGMAHRTDHAGRAHNGRRLLELLRDVFGNTPFRGRPRLGKIDYSMGRDCDIFGNNFCPIVFDPHWKTAAACGIAAAMYNSRDFGSMPILADALEEAGCDLPRILTHCRMAGGHVRGCWVVDIVLAKQ